MILLWIGVVLLLIRIIFPFINASRRRQHYRAVHARNRSTSFQGPVGPPQPMSPAQQAALDIYWMRRDFSEQHGVSMNSPKGMEILRNAPTGLNEYAP